MIKISEYIGIEGIKMSMLKQDMINYLAKEISDDIIISPITAIYNIPEFISQIVLDHNPEIKSLLFKTKYEYVFYNKKEAERFLSYLSTDGLIKYINKHDLNICTDGLNKSEIIDEILNKIFEMNHQYTL